MSKVKILHLYGKDRYDGRFEYLIINPPQGYTPDDFIAPGDEVMLNNLVSLNGEWENIPEGLQFNRADL